MYNAELFLGIPLVGALLEEFERADEALVGMFTSDHGDYLADIVYGGQRYLGRFAGDVCTVDQLELLKGNIYSLLDKLVAPAASREVPLVLFPVVVPAST